MSLIVFYLLSLILSPVVLFPSQTGSSSTHLLFALSEPWCSLICIEVSFLTNIIINNNGENYI
jgi:hypothetical protein